MPRVVDKAARRRELARAAEAVFAERGVANTAVSDIVAEAGVAQGTFYLYFDSKDDVLVAVAERVMDGVMDAAEAAMEEGASAVRQLRAFIDALSRFDETPGAAELAEVLHRPENRLLHDRLEERMVPRLVPLMEGIVARGCAEGVFEVPDPRTAAWFVLGGLRGAEMAGTPTDRIPEVLAAALWLALQTLGYRGAPDEADAAGGGGAS